MQCQKTCQMATDTINMPDEGGMQGCNCKCEGTESIQNLCPLLPLLWLNAFLLGNHIQNGQLLLVCPNNVWPATQGVKLKAEVFASWGNQQQAEHPMGIAQVIYLRQNHGVPNTLEQGTKSEVAHKWAGWLHNPFRLRHPECIKMGDKIIGGPQVGQVAT